MKRPRSIQYPKFTHSLFKHGLGCCGSHISLIDPKNTEAIRVEPFWKPKLAQITLTKRRIRPKTLVRHKFIGQDFTGGIIGEHEQTGLLYPLFQPGMIGAIDLHQLAPPWPSLPQWPNLVLLAGFEFVRIGLDHDLANGLFTDFDSIPLEEFLIGQCRSKPSIVFFLTILGYFLLFLLIVNYG